jgi:two-component system, response regulator PdtaR
VGHRTLGPASCRAEAVGLLAEGAPHLAFVDIELRGGESGIELAAELQRRGVPCIFATGQPGRAREHRALALGLVPKPYNPLTILDVVRYFEALSAGQRPAHVPRGLELFGADALPVSFGSIDTPAAAVTPGATSEPPVGAPSAAVIAAGTRAQTDQRLGDAGVLAALTA